MAPVVGRSSWSVAGSRAAAARSGRGPVAEVEQQDVPVHTEWVGTTDGYINAQIRAKVQGYLLTQGATGTGPPSRRGSCSTSSTRASIRRTSTRRSATWRRPRPTCCESQENEAKYRPLVAVGAVSQREYDNTVQEVRANQAAVEAAQASVAAAKLNVDWTKITSPDRGRRRDHAGADRRPDLAGDRHDHGVAGGPDQGLLPDQRAGVPAVRRRHRAIPPHRRRQPRARRSSWSSPTATSIRARASCRPSTGRSSRRPAPSRSSRSSTIPTTCCVRASSPGSRR